MGPDGHGWNRTEGRGCGPEPNLFELSTLFCIGYDRIGTQSVCPKKTFRQFHFARQTADRVNRALVITALRRSGWAIQESSDAEFRLPPEISRRYPRLPPSHLE